jgi:hypothetical protein
MRGGKRLGAGRKKGIETKRVLFTMPASKVKILKPLIKRFINDILKQQNATSPRITK